MLFILSLFAFMAEGRLLSTFFHDDMVLQYDNARLYGWAVDKSGNPVSVKVDTSVKNQISGRETKSSATSDGKTGYWQVIIPAYTPGSGESISDKHKITVNAGELGTTITINDVLFGNVFLCGGQSNMASIAVRHAENNKAELELAGNGALITPCGSHSNQRFTYNDKTGQLIVGGRCLAYHAEEAAIDTAQVLTMEDCAVDIDSAKAAGQYFESDASTGHITGLDGSCLNAYVEGWSWERCGYAEPNIEMGACCSQPYCSWDYDQTTGHIMNKANSLCITGINDDDSHKDDPFEHIRIFRTEIDYTNETLNELRNIATQWTKPTVTTLAKFSAVCWYMGRSLYENQPQKGMPIGLVESAVSGTYIEAWSTADALAKCPCHAGPQSSYNTPEVLWNAMIAPMRYAAFAGMSWYQAECNINNAECYKCMFPAMITDWREKFPTPPSGKPFPFAFVEITPRSTDPDFSAGDLRLAQQSAFSISRTAMAATQDLGDAESPFNTEHPRVKKPIGHRLALQLRKLLFGEDIPDAIPEIKDVTLNSDKKSVTVTFSKATFGGDMTIRTNVYCPVDSKYCADSTFEVMGTDGNWYPATFSRLPSEKDFGVVVTAGSTFPTSGSVTQIRHLYAAWPVPVIYGKSGIPLSPFLYKF